MNNKYLIIANGTELEVFEAGTQESRTRLLNRVVDIKGHLDDGDKQIASKIIDGDDSVFSTQHGGSLRLARLRDLNVYLGVKS